MTCLVIPSADATPESPDLLDSLLWSIESQAIHNSYPVIVCFDRVHTNFIHHFTDKYPFIDAITNSGNRLNFARNSNRGLRRAFFHYNDHAIVVNQDTMIPSKQFLDQICGEGIVSPQQVTLDGTKEEKLALLNKMNEEQEESRQQHNKLVGFFLFMNKQVMSKVGFWDEYFITFEDDDYSCRTLLAGFPVETVGYMVHHEVSKCGAYDGYGLQLNFAKFKYKWSIPPEIEHLDCNPWIIKNHSYIPEMRCE